MDITQLYKNEEYHLIMLLHEYFLIRMQERIKADYDANKSYHQYLEGYKAFKLFLIITITELIFKNFNARSIRFGCLW